MALGVGSALLIVAGYYDELVVTGDVTPRWEWWFIFMRVSLYIVYERLVGLAAVNAIETDAQIARKSTRRK